MAPLNNTLRVQSFGMPKPKHAHFETCIWFNDTPLFVTDHSLRRKMTAAEGGGGGQIPTYLKRKIGIHRVSEPSVGMTLF